MARWNPVEQMQDLVNKMGGEEGVTRFLSGDLILAPRDPQALLMPVGEPTALGAITKFAAAEAFTKASMNENFKKFFLPLVEKDIPATTLTISELTRSVRDWEIASALKVHEHGAIALAHLFQVAQRTKRWHVGYVVGTDGDTWAVSVDPYGSGLYAYAYPLGYDRSWGEGHRFLSRDSAPLTA